MAIDSEKLLTAKIDDLYKRCDKYAKAVFSDFLDPASQISVNENSFNNNGYRSVWFGGFTDAERKILGVFPDWEEATEEVFPIAALKIECKYDAKLSHRDYLGAVLSLGIDRSKIGDILVEENTAVIFALDTAADYIKNNIVKIGRCGIKITVLKFDEIVLPEPKFEIINTVAASERIDAVLAAALKLSRANTAKLINSGKVQINYKLCDNVSKNLCIGDLISVRGFGRLLFDNIGSETRSGRYHISLKRYV